MTTKPTFGSKEARQAHLETVLRRLTDEAACRQCLDQLDAYISAQLAGQDYLTTYPALAVHLDSCLGCADAYARLYDLALAEAADQLPQPDQMPAPDLSFLPTPSAQPALSLRQQVEQALNRVGSRLSFNLSAELLNLLQPPAPAAALRAAEERYGEILAQLEPAQVPGIDFPLKLTIFRDAQKGDMVLVEAIIAPPDRSWPNLAGSHVRLISGAGRHEAVTDAWGLVAFEDIPLAEIARLRLEVTLADE